MTISDGQRNLNSIPALVSMKNIFLRLLLCIVLFGNFGATFSFFDTEELTENEIRNIIRRQSLPARENLMDPVHGIKMGISNSECDDGKTNLTIDWNGSPVNYTCYTPKQPLPVSEDVLPAVECDPVPKGHTPLHFCMDTKLTYDTPLPTYADHRPLWAQFGEYHFVPPQRWSHNVEHGAVVMLYHPCANPSAVKKLKRIVTGCIWKHVIAASNMVPPDRPLVLITWGCRLRMSAVDENLVRNFIKTHGLRGPEGRYSKDGQYDVMLINPALVPAGSTRDDDVLCPSKRKVFPF